MKILILGAKGALGSELVRVFAKHKPDTFDREDLDITNEALVAAKVAELRPEVIINCAAYNDVDRAEDERSMAENINGYALGFIAKAANSIGALLVHFSSNYVFDGQKDDGYKEDDVPNPPSSYAKSKLLGEMELQRNTDKFYLVRTAWLYGGRSDVLLGVPTSGTAGGRKKSFPEKMLELAGKDQDINVIGDEFGNPTYVPDLAEAVRQLIESGKPYGIYHLINTGVASWYDWAREIFSIKGIQAKLASVPADNFQRKAIRPKNGGLLNTKFTELRPWTEALKDYLK